MAKSLTVLTFLLLVVCSSLLVTAKQVSSDEECVIPFLWASNSSQFELKWWITIPDVNYTFAHGGVDLKRDIYWTLGDYGITPWDLRNGKQLSQEIKLPQLSYSSPSPMSIDFTPDYSKAVLSGTAYTTTGPINEETYVGYAFVLKFNDVQDRRLPSVEIILQPYGTCFETSSDAILSGDIVVDRQGVAMHYKGNVVTNAFVQWNVTEASITHNATVQTRLMPDYYYGIGKRSADRSHFIFGDGAANGLDVYHFTPYDGNFHPKVRVSLFDGSPTQGPFIQDIAISRTTVDGGRFAVCQDPNAAETLATDTTIARMNTMDIVAHVYSNVSVGSLPWPGECDLEADWCISGCISAAFDPLSPDEGAVLHTIVNVPNQYRVYNSINGQLLYQLEFSEQSCSYDALSISDDGRYLFLFVNNDRLGVYLRKKERQNTKRPSSLM